MKNDMGFERFYFRKVEVLKTNKNYTIKSSQTNCIVLENAKRLNFTF